MFIKVLSCLGNYNYHVTRWLLPQAREMKETSFVSEQGIHCISTNSGPRQSECYLTSHSSNVRNLSGRRRHQLVSRKKAPHCSQLDLADTPGWTCWRDTAPSRWDTPGGSKAGQLWEGLRGKENISGEFRTSPWSDLQHCPGTAEINSVTVCTNIHCSH